jgi:hypothetical protein
MARQLRISSLDAELQESLMSRLFWFAAGMGAGVWAYRYLQESGGRVPGFESLEGPGRQLTESSRQFAEASRMLAQATREFTQTLTSTAQARGREMMDRGQSVVTKASEADWRGDPIGAAKSVASQAAQGASAQREDVTIEPDAG